jgi:hypothetical protein
MIAAIDSGIGGTVGVRTRPRSREAIRRPDPYWGSLPPIGPARASTHRSANCGAALESDSHPTILGRRAWFTVVLARDDLEDEMDRETIARACACALTLVVLACGDDADSNGQPMAGTGAGFGGMGFSGTGAGTGGAAGGGAPNMPDAACMAAAGADNPACSACACTPNALGGCLNEVTACQMGADAMANQLCGAILTCARMNNCTGEACITPCMSQIFAAISYMGGIATMNASTVGMCTATSCAAVCPTNAMMMP